MKPKTLIVLTGLAVLSASCSSSKTYSISAKSGTQTEGTAKFTQTGNDVVLNLEVNNLTPGVHAVHIHEKADCSSPTAESAGGHWNPSKSDHGKWGNAHFHMGDIGNLVADHQGKAKLTFRTDKWCMDCPEEAKTIMGRGLIIHAGKDDYMTQPTGNAGGRVGCVEIK